FPAEEKRPLADCLHQAIRNLDSLHHKLTTYLPRYLLDLAPTPGQPRGELLEGAFIFADVTGFTALTGELSKRGTAGREEMNRLMRALFGALLDPLLASGGDLLIFAGDAALAYFPARPDQPAGHDARWAARTALRLVQSIAPFAHLETPYGDFSLTMSAGVERGQAFGAVVGTRRRMEFLISGGAIQGATAAEGSADPSQVFAGPNIRPFLSPGEFKMRGGVVEGIQGGELDDYEAVPPARRRARLSAIFSRRVPDLLEHLRQTLGRVEGIVPFIPPDLFSQIARGEDIRQHPPVAIQFVNVMGLEDMALGPAGPEQATAVLQRYFVQAQEIVTEREGIISQMDTYAKGFTLLNPFGAPTHHEGIPRLAASAALELARLLEQVNREFHLDPPLTQRTGMTYDRIFTGEIGYRHRREYVVAGPAVNLAARLMSKAEPGQIVLDPATWERVEEDFLADSLPPILLKGIPKPVPRFNLRGLRQGKGLRLTDYPLAGREEELLMLEKRLRKAAAGKGGALALIGEAGIGKSRLVAALADSARQQGMTVLSGGCRPFAKTTPYFPWKDLVARWFELDAETAPQTRRLRLKQQLAQLNLTTSLPAFVDLMGLPAADLASRAAQTQTGPAKSVPSLFAALQKRTNKPTNQLGWASLAERTAQAKTGPAESSRPSLWDILRERASIPQALHLALKRQTRQSPTLLVIEDIQWIDDEARNILADLTASAPARPLFLLTTARPDTGWEGERLSLSPLPDAGSRDLAAFALQATQLETELADWLLARAGGSPLFILSYCRALRDADAVVVDPASGEARWSGPPPQLPLSLREILLAQVEQLDEQAQGVMQRGSVIGVAFPNWLITRLFRINGREAALAHDALPPGQLDEALGRAARRSLVAPPPPGRIHAFSSHSLQDALYTTLSHAQRREWHEEVGDQLAQADEQTRYERLEQIAHHYSRSRNPHKAACFTRLAGDKARARQADEAALAFYAQTLDVSGNEEIAAEQRLAHEGIGDVHALRSEGEAAIAAYQAALQGAQSQDERRLKTKLALLAPLVGPAKPRLLEEAQHALPASDPLRPWLDAALVWLHADQGKTESAISLCRDALAQTKEPVGTLLREALESLEAGERLPRHQNGRFKKLIAPYADFFALFARSNLRCPLAP
ncbi:MAG: AAA family ATPase, partial [Chloroflexota bacterium]|nr:AAA family ATPase [Chloroflexota bacterium]